MPIVHDLKPSFNAGELSPRLAGRVDFTKFPNGLELLQNFIPLSEGGITRRSGSRYVADTKTSTVKSRLKKFEFSTTQAYILEYGEQNIRFYRNQGQIFSEDITASITNGTFTGNITGWDDVSSGGGSISHDATNDRLNLNANGANLPHAEQEVTNATAIEHVCRFQILGAAGDFVTFRVGTSSTSANIINFSAGVGFHTIAFTATAANFFLQFIGASSKVTQVDNVSLIDNAPIELTTPYAEADLFTIEGPQSADVLYQFHRSYPPYKLERRGNTTWSFIEVAFKDGPYLDQNTTATTLTPSAIAGKSLTITASGVIGINDDTGFQPTDVGRLIRIDNAASGVDWGAARIVSVTSTTVVLADIIAGRSFSATTGDVNWRFGSWSDTTGYPWTGTFFEQRLYTGNSTTQPQTFWASQTDDFENFTPDSDPTTDTIFDGTVEDDDAITYTLAADDINAIFWMTAGEDSLSIGTSGGVWIPSSQGAAITPLDIAVKRQVTSKAAKVQPVRVDNVVLFSQKAKRKVLEFSFSFETDGFKSADMTRLAQHITKGGIVEMTYAEEPDSVVWVVREDGVLLGMTFRRDEDVVGWGRNILGGRFPGGNSVATASDISFTAPDTITSAASLLGGFETGDVLFITDSTSNNFAQIDFLTVEAVADDGSTVTTVEQTVVTEAAAGTDSIIAMSEAVVESVAVIPGADESSQVLPSNDRDEVWVQVKRTINGSTVRQVELLETQFEDGDIQSDAFYIDSGITYDGVSTTAITGLAHLEGETVRIWADGSIQPDQIVSGGAITLDTAAKKAQIGLPYSHLMKTLRIEGGNPAGTSVGKIQRIYAISFILLNSHTLSFGPSLTELENHDFREVSDPMDEGVPFFTGSTFHEFDGNWSDDPRIFIKNDDPAPFTLLAMAPERGDNALK